MQKIEVAVLIFIIIVAAIALFLFWERGKWPSLDICTVFKEVRGEVSCNEAAQFALEAYPGKVLSIENKEVIVSVTKDAGQLPINPETTPPPPHVIEVYIAWFIGLETIRPIVLPSSNINTFDVIVDTKEKKILAVFGK